MPATDKITHIVESRYLYFQLHSKGFRFCINVVISIDNIENFVKGETANDYAENYASYKDGEENMIAIYDGDDLVDCSDNYRI